MNKNYQEYEVCCFNCKYADVDYEDTYCEHPDELEHRCRVNDHGYCDWFEEEGK